MAIDLRRNGGGNSRGPKGMAQPAEPAPAQAPAAAGPPVPLHFCGNAVWCVHVPSPPAPAAAGAAAASPLEGDPLVAALRAGAAGVRGCLLELRGEAQLPTAATAAAAGCWGPSSSPPEGNKTSCDGAGGGGGGVGVGGAQQVLQLALRQLRSPLAAQAAMMARVCVAQDAMLTSWQFPYWATDFGCSSGGSSGSSGNRPVQYQCVLQPSPPWSAAVMPAPPAQPGGGLVVLLMVPEGAAAALRGSRVVRRLAPGAVFQ